MMIRRTTTALARSDAGGMQMLRDMFVSLGQAAGANAMTTPPKDASRPKSADPPLTRGAGKKNEPPAGRGASSQQHGSDRA
eukprot:CAMPEP_0174828748 /NCGR_PEP_ID=MMETSP1114-20130205/1516_1 /TAXON_ID=312471 /ORGANISM="Neobodo designis, Strain CCAP 1951/1" /LENGTH=80 /DNA_ID=CAMNT_0016062473 /DNA_START=84 /DNA_END=326 /DNA_ORIENTATION=+